MDTVARSSALPGFMTAAVTVDAAGALMGGAARYLDELRGYLKRTGREDVEIIGSRRQVRPGWLVYRELSGRARSRRVALNNVGFVTPGGQRWTLLRNALHFLTEDEQVRLDPAQWASVRRDAMVVHLAARRSDVIVAPSTAMKERITTVRPDLSSRVVVRPHPVSAVPFSRPPGNPIILCPVLFSPYKKMEQRLTELLTAVGDRQDLSVRVQVTADMAEVPAVIASHPQVEIVGRLPGSELGEMRTRSHAIYFPTGLESFGYPLAEARVSGQPVIARDTAQNREIAGPALCGYTPGDPDSLRRAVQVALKADIAPDPGPFDPDRYFEWLLGVPR
jgi:glycosyltransferase involved in cell wall biosynthesis